MQCHAWLVPHEAWHILQYKIEEALKIRLYHPELRMQFRMCMHTMQRLAVVAPFIPRVPWISCRESCCCVRSNIADTDLQATMYPNAYGANCESGSTQPYGMPNFGSLAKDPLLPQRCQDPTQMQVSNFIAYPFP